MNNHLKHSRNELPHLEEGLGRGFYPQLFFYRRKPDFFLTSSLKKYVFYN